MTTSARVFINYRRSDSAGWARQLHGDLGERFGAERVFRDVAIEPGVDFVEHIESVMDACEVCIAVIGPRWATAATADGRRRLADSGDLVRLEIERALQRPDVQVIPVLVDGARMPDQDELPESLRALARRNACELTDARWEHDVEMLCQHLHRVLGESTLEQAVRLRPDPTAARRRSGPERGREPKDAPVPAMAVALSVLATLAAAAVAGFAAALLIKPLPEDAEGWGRVAAYAVERGMVWAIIGAGAAAVAAATFGRARVPVGAALIGASAGLLGGAAGAAGYYALRVGGVKEVTAHWLLALPLHALPGLLLAAILARVAGARVGECQLAAIAGASVAALPVLQDPRPLRLTLGAVLVVGAIVAMVAVQPHRAPYRPA